VPKVDVSSSGYYAWLKRSRSTRAREDAILTGRIRQIHLRSRGTYGAPRIHAELADEGMHVGRKRVARLMQAADLRGVSRRKFFRTTIRQARYRPAPDLVERNFSAAGPNRLWVGDITYVSTWTGNLYLAVVVDACLHLWRRHRWSRRVVGWAMATHLRAELVLDALDMAIRQRHPLGVIHHSDQGSQYTSLAFGKRCRKAGVRPSMGSVGDAYDNALCESFFATLECELLDRHRFHSQQEAGSAVFEFTPSRCLSGLKDGITRIDAILPWVSHRRCAMRSHMVEQHDPEVPYCPPYRGNSTTASSVPSPCPSLTPRPRTSSACGNAGWSTPIAVFPSSATRSRCPKPRCMSRWSCISSPIRTRVSWTSASGTRTRCYSPPPCH
jgi:putative transposase